jgi:hypothetical protein
MSELDEAKKKTANLTSDDQWTLISHLIRERMGEDPSQEVAVCGPNDTPQVYIVPARLWFERRMESDLNRDASEDIGQTVPLSHALRVMARGGTPKDVADQLDKLPTR